MGNLIPLFRTDPITKWGELRKKIWKDAESYYEQVLKQMEKSLNHMVYLCSPLKSTAEKLIQVHIAEAIWAGSQILGAEYKGKKIHVWIPHLHLFSIYNEALYPEAREKAIKFNNYLIQKYFHTLLVIGERISGGMAAEMRLAKKNKLEIITMKEFKKHLKNLPSSEEAQNSYQTMVNLHNGIHGPTFLIKQ